MDELNAMQYATLNAMGIPVWEKLVEPVKNQNIDTTQDRSVAIPTTGAATDCTLPLLGNPNAALLFIGEELALDGMAPSSRLFLAMLSAIGLRHNDIAVLPWYVEYTALLNEHLNITKVTQIMLLGESTIQDCFSQQSIESLRGERQEIANIKARVAYHPSDLLDQPSKKAAVWQDLQDFRDA